MYLYLSDLIQIKKLDREQLEELCATFFALLQERQTNVPAFTFIPGVFEKPLPYIPPVFPGNPTFPGGTTI